MPDNKHKRKSDARLVASKQKYEVNYVAEKYGVDPGLVRFVIKHVGHKRKDIERTVRQIVKWVLR